MAVDHALRGIHHITLVASTVQRTVHFYVDVLGLRLVKRTVNFDRPTTHHLYFGDRTGAPGTLITFFEWPGAPPARLGVGVTHHLALTVGSYDALLQWKTWLQHNHLLVAGPFDHRAYRSLVFTDPDGVLLELATSGPGWNALSGEDTLLPHGRLASATWPEPVLQITEDMAIHGLHHISSISSDLGRTGAFYEEILDIPRLHQTVDPDDPDIDRWYWSAGAGGAAVPAGGGSGQARDAGGRPGTVITYTSVGNQVPVIHGRVGHGLTHHFALEVEDDEALEYWRQLLEQRQVQVTPVRDREYHRSIYFEDPDGQVLEIATAGPGFMVDEPMEGLGQSLMLPAWLEPERAEIEAKLPRI
jgi:glyoxalase family protein